MNADARDEIYLIYLTIYIYLYICKKSYFLVYLFSVQFLHSADSIVTFSRARLIRGNNLKRFFFINRIIGARVSLLYRFHKFSQYLHFSFINFPLFHFLFTHKKSNIFIQFKLNLMHVLIAFYLCKPAHLYTHLLAKISCLFLIHRLINSDI